MNFGILAYEEDKLNAEQFNRASREMVPDLKALLKEGKRGEGENHRIAYQFGRLSRSQEKFQQQELLKTEEVEVILSNLIGYLDSKNLLNELKDKRPEYKKRFLIQVGDKIRKIDVLEVAWFFAHNKGVYMRTFQNQTYQVEGSLDCLEQTLDPRQFFRINRKFLVNVDAITGMIVWSRGRIKLELNPRSDDEFESVVSIDRVSDFKKWLTNC